LLNGPSVKAVSLAAYAGRTGRGVTIAVVDSGIHAGHPHVGPVAGGISIDDEGRTSGDIGDRLGHGTAVAGAIRERAPDASLVAVKVFDRTLSTSGRALVEAIRWAGSAGVSLINLSLGTINRDHEAALADAVDAAARRGALVVAAAPQDGSDWLPGGLAQVIGVEADRALARDQYSVDVDSDNRIRIRASAFPRRLPGVSAADSFQGPSFAVANVSGLLALMLQDEPVRSTSEWLARLVGDRR
jgi:subtilisin family serine protease